MGLRTLDTLVCAFDCLDMCVDFTLHHFVSPVSDNSVSLWFWTLNQYLALVFELGAPLLLGVRKLRPIGFAMGIGR